MTPCSTRVGVLKRLALTAKILAIALSVGLFWQAHAQTPAPLKIGLIGPFSGPSSDFGIPMRNGVALAIAEINAVGGYLGRPIELVIKDDKGDPELGLKGSQELVAEAVIATLGFCNTGVALKSLDVYQSTKTPLIVNCATGSAITAKYPAPDSFIFRGSASDTIQAPFVIDDLMRRGLRRVAIFADSTGYGEGGLKDVTAALAKKDLQPVYVGRFPLGVKDLRSQLTEAREAGANVIFSYTVGPESATIANGRKALNWRVPQVGAWTLSFPFFLQGAKDAAEGALMAQTFIAEPSNERRSAFLTAYRHKYNESMTVPMAAAQGYDSAYLLTYALFATRDGKLTGTSVKASLETLERTYYGVVATYQHPFTAQDKEALSANMLVMGRVKNNLVTFAYPEDAKKNLQSYRKQSN